MLLLPGETLPEGPNWIYELKLDGYRALAIKTGRKVQLRSRNDNDFTGKYPLIVKALAALPDETVIDGELVALDGSGRPSFNTLQNHGTVLQPRRSSITSSMSWCSLAAHSRGEPLDVRRGLLQTKVLPKLKEPIRHAAELNGSVPDLLKAVRAYGFEGLIAKRRDSLYEPGLRSGAWQKMRVHQGQEFVIGGYTPSAGSFDALILGYYEGDRLLFVARTRNGFTPHSRLDLLKTAPKIGNGDMSLCQSAGDEKRALGARAYGGEDGGMPLGQA